MALTIEKPSLVIKEVQLKKQKKWSFWLLNWHIKNKNKNRAGEYMAAHFCKLLMHVYIGKTTLQDNLTVQVRSLTIVDTLWNSKST